MLVDAIQTGKNDRKFKIKLAKDYRSKFRIPESMLHFIGLRPIQKMISVKNCVGIRVPCVV